MAVAQVEVAGRQGGIYTPVGRKYPMPAESESGTVEVTFGTVMRKMKNGNAA